MASAERDAVNLIRNRFFKRVLVVLRAAPAWLAAVVAVAPVVASAVAAQLPTAWASEVTNVGIRVVAIAGGALLVIRRVSPVVKEERGLLAKDGVLPWQPAAQPDSAELAPAPVTD